MRLIDVEKLYNERPEYLNERHVTNGEFNRGWNACNKMWSETVREQPTIEMPRWIPVTERLPDSQEDVLVVAFWHERWQTMIGWHSDSGKKWRVITPHGEREPGGVTHWMPLPEPPKDGDNEC